MTTTSPRVTSGQLLMATGAIHSVVGVLVGLGANSELGGRNLFAEIARDGGVASIGHDLGRMTLFWFLFCGFAILIMGSLMHRFERRGEVLPASLGWHLGALTIVGCLMIPISGFWLLVPQAWWIIHRAGRAARR